MNLRKMSDYLAVLEHGSIGAAANALGVSQPGLSKGIRKLEQELGVALLERLPRGVRPTVCGAVLGRCATTVTAEMGRTLAEIRAIRDGTGGTVRAGAGPDWLFSVVPRAVASLHEHSPGVQVRLFGGFNDELRAMLTARGSRLLSRHIAGLGLRSGCRARALDYRPIPGDRAPGAPGPPASRPHSAGPARIRMGASRVITGAATQP